MTLPTHRPLIGVAFMLAAMAILPGIDVIAKLLGQEGMAILQIVWARVAFGALLTLPFALKIGGRAGLLPDRPVYHLFRAGFLIAATFLFFTSLKTLPIADALAIFFVQPLIVTVLSALVLREKVGPRRWTAVAIGFLGTLIIIRPGLAVWNPGSLYALGAGTCLAIYFVMTRSIAGSAHAMVTTFQTNAMGTLITSVGVWAVWQAPTAGEWAMFAALGAIATFGHYLIVRAYDHAEASLLAPLAYTEMVTSTLLGWWVFRDLPDGWTFLGVGILIGCAVYISVRERQVKGRLEVPPEAIETP